MFLCSTTQSKEIQHANNVLYCLILVLSKIFCAMKPFDAFVHFLCSATIIFLTWCINHIFYSDIVWIVQPKHELHGYVRIKLLQVANARERVNVNLFFTKCFIPSRYNLSYQTIHQIRYYNPISGVEWKIWMCICGIKGV